MTFWQIDKTMVKATSDGAYHYETTAEADEYVTVDLTPRLVSAGAASLPTVKLFQIVDGAADLEVTPAPDAPTLNTNTLTQRLRNLTPGAYRYRWTFTSSGNIVPVTLVVVCVE